MKRYSTLAFLLFYLTSCTSDKVPVQERIIGTWKIDRAMRNDRITKSLEGLYMEFDNASAFSSNLLGDTATFACTIDERAILLEHPLIRKFDIQELTDTSMRLTTKLQDNDLSFLFKR